MLPIELHIAFDCDRRHPEGTRDLRLSRIAIDDQLGTKKPESRQSTLLMDKHRQMAIKVVHLSIPLLKGDLRIDVRDSCRKDRQLYLWHAEIVATFGQKKQPSSPSSTRAKPSHLSSSSCLSAARGGSGVLKLLYAVKGGLYRGPAAASLTNGQATSQFSISPMLNRFGNVPLNGEHVAAIPLPLVGSERSLAEDRKPAKG